ncbi:uncharacterized protein LOC122379601 [Amphibalanus amphitrite]|uniref:uncharacterized protein LOC122379601 n=1 Tax=Amphibalanus amphitrite TaxID=1232801 RepID=UPI001C901468|nr:uncharacterized protein LOC122379601 [Amphibalanus amphitrite]
MSIIDSSRSPLSHIKDGVLGRVARPLHHFKKIPAEGRRIVGDSKSGLVDYIADKFPLLLMHVWEAAVIRRDEPDIRDFYTAFSIIKVDPNTVILPAGVGTIEMAELRSSRETVERMSVSAADLPRLKGQLLEGLNHLNVRGPEVTEPRWPGWDEDDGLSVSLQGVTADTISHLADLGQTVGRLEIYGEQRQHGQADDIRAQRMANTE